MNEDINNFLKKQNDKIDNMYNEFFQYFNKSDYSIIAITLKNFDKLITWRLLDIDYIERFLNKQPIIKIGNLSFKASDYPPYSKLVLDINKKKNFVLTPENKIDLNGLELLAERKRLSSFGEIWEISNIRLQQSLKSQLISIRVGNEFLHSFDYRENIFLIENKFNRQKFLCNNRGQVIMKKDK